MQAAALRPKMTSCNVCLTICCLLRSFHQEGSPSAEHCDLLQTNNTFLYNVGGIYIWNGGSWDVQGIYPESTDVEGSWRVPTITPLIEAYNLQAAAHNGQSPTTSGVGGIAPSSVSSLGTPNIAGTTVNPSAASSGAGSSSGVLLSPVQSSG